ncbi:MAG: hypothetical protein I8H87_04060 [Comamonadaceae bacterium]|nr:hypothetical protein [Comamonadaceae bacterium]
MQKTIATVLAISTALSTTGCATSSSNITASYTAPLQYQAYDCAQLTSEAQRVQGRADQLAGRLDEAASNDKVLMGVGLVLFWPALFALGGTKQQEADYARLKGEHDALGQAMIAKKCDQAGLPASVQPPAPQPPAASSSPAGASS